MQKYVRGKNVIPKGTPGFKPKNEFESAYRKFDSAVMAYYHNECVKTDVEHYEGIEKLCLELLPLASNLSELNEVHSRIPRDCIGAFHAVSQRREELQSVTNVIHSEPCPRPYEYLD